MDIDINISVVEITTITLLYAAGYMLYGADKMPYKAVWLPQFLLSGTHTTARKR